MLQSFLCSLPHDIRMSDQEGEVSRICSRHGINLKHLQT